MLSVWFFNGEINQKLDPFWMLGGRYGSCGWTPLKTGCFDCHFCLYMWTYQRIILSHVLCNLWSVGQCLLCVVKQQIIHPALQAHKKKSHMKIKANRCHQIKKWFIILNFDLNLPFYFYCNCSVWVKLGTWTMTCKCFWLLLSSFTLYGDWRSGEWQWHVS